MSRVDVRTIRRQQILEAAERLVVRRSWAEISVLDICQEAGVTSGVLTYHFSNKEEIMLTLLEAFIARMDAHLHEAVRGSLTPQDDIRSFTEALTSLLEQDPHIPLLLIQFASAALDKPEIRERLHGLFAGFRQRKLREWQEAGVIIDRIDERAMTLVSMLHTVMLGVMLARPFLGIDLPNERLLEETKHLLLACFTAYKAEPSPQ